MGLSVALVDYGMGNLLSVRKALAAVGGEDLDVRMVEEPSALAGVAGVVLPGVGHFGDGMRNLKERKLDKALLRVVDDGTPLLGICIGMQLLFERSEEAPGVEGLSILKGEVRRFPESLGLKIPQIGWNSMDVRCPHPWLGDVRDGEYFYFVHSYYPVPADDSVVVGVTDYGMEFCSCVGRENLLATQFHPEKSQDAGLAILAAFLRSLR